jgi:hypothetical protein
MVDLTADTALARVEMALGALLLWEATGDDQGLGGEPPEKMAVAAYQMVREARRLLGYPALGKREPVQ